MDQPLNSTLVGRVLRSSTVGYDCGTHSTRLSERHSFGAFVEAPVTTNGEPPTLWAIGLVYAVRVDDDPLVSELVRADSVEENVLRDQRENRLIPVEISVINVGYRDDSRTYPGLPPRPPMSLSDVLQCDPAVIYDFTRRHDFFRLVLNASSVPSDDLLAASIRYAVTVAYPQDERYGFIVGAGQQLVRVLGNDLKRLRHLLTLIHPAQLGA